jgi:two-component system, NarL family, response regulator
MREGPGGPVRILIVDDHVAIRIGLTSMLESHDGIEVIGAVATGEEVLNSLKAGIPDILLVDLRMPHLDGITLIQEIRRSYAGVRIIVLTSYEADEDIYKAVRAGIQGYLLKDAPEQDLLDAVAAVHAGRSYFPAHIASRLAERLQRSNLSSRELEVLEMLSKGLTNKQIAGALGISSHTIRSHVANITDKLEVCDRTEAVSIAMRRGIIHME